MGTQEKVEWKFSADTQEVLRAWQAMVAGQESVIKKLDQMGKTGKQSGDSMTEGLLKAAVAMTGIGSAASIAQMGIRLVTNEYQRMLDTQKKIAELQNNEAGARRALMFNLAATPAAEREKYAAGLEQVARETGMSRSVIFNAGSEAGSARGNLSLDDSLEAVRLAARARPDDPETMTAMAKGLLDMSHVTGTNDPKQNFGFLLGALDPARIENPVRFGMNIIPAMTASKEFGNSAQQSRAMAAAISSQLVDLTGEKTKTAMIQLDSGLAEFFKGKPELTNSQSRMEFLQQNPSMWNSFRKKFTADTSTEPILEKMATQGGDGMGIYRGALGLPGLEEGGANAETLIQQLNKDPKQQSASIGRKTNAAIESVLADDTLAGREAKLREAVSSAVGNIQYGGMSFPNLNFSGQLATGAGSPEAAAIQTLQSYQKSATWSEGGGVYRPQGERESKDVQLLQAVIDAIREQTKLMDENAKLPQDLTIRDPYNGTQRPATKAAASLGD